MEEAPIEQSCPPRNVANEGFGMSRDWTSPNCLFVSRDICDGVATAPFRAPVPTQFKPSGLAARKRVLLHNCVLHLPLTVQTIPVA
jgi:hypothetical protein